jgi:hypothetical protein
VVPPAGSAAGASSFIATGVIRSPLDAVSGVCRTARE